MKPNEMPIKSKLEYGIDIVVVKMGDKGSYVSS